jgi:adenylate kinase family enzyme
MFHKVGDMKRIAIIGSPGSGKSTLARKLGEISGLPVFHLDRLFWNPGWVQSPKPVWIALQSALVAQDSWIIDGNYGATLHIRAAAADTIIFLDFPRYLCLGRAVKRVWQYRGSIRPDMAPGCPEKIDREFLHYIWRFPVDERPQILSQLRLASERGASVIQLTRSQQMTQYIKSLEK